MKNNSGVDISKHLIDGRIRVSQNIVLKMPF